MVFFRCGNVIVVIQNMFTDYLEMKYCVVCILLSNNLTKANKNSVCICLSVQIYIHINVDELKNVKC